MLNFDSSNSNSSSEKSKMIDYAAFSSCAMILFNRITAFSKVNEPVLSVVSKLMISQSVSAQIVGAKLKDYTTMNLHAEALFKTLKNLAVEHKVAYDILNDYDILKSALVKQVKHQLSMVGIDSSCLTEENVKTKIEKICENGKGIGEGWEDGDPQIDHENSDEPDFSAVKSEKKKKVTLDSLDENSLKGKTLEELNELEKECVLQEKFELAMKVYSEKNSRKQK